MVEVGDSKDNKRCANQTINSLKPSIMYLKLLVVILLGAVCVCVCIYTDIQSDSNKVYCMYHDIYVI